LLLAIVLSFVLLASPAVDDPDELLARGARLAELGQPAVAATAYGEALAHRSLESDLLGQQRVSDELLGFLGENPDPSWLAGVMGELPAKHNGVFVSAHGLARALAFDAVARQDFLLGRELGDALEAHGKLRWSGAAADTFALVGEALAKLARYEGRGAIKPLTKAFDEMIEQGWQEPAVYVGTELVAQLVLQREDDDARAVIETLAAGFPGGGDLLLLRRWRDLVDDRLAEVPGSVLAAQRELLSYLTDEQEPGAEDGPNDDDSDGSAEVSPGGSPTAVVAALNGRRAVLLLSVERDETVWIVKSPLGSGLELSIDISPGVIILDHEGVVFALDGPAVAVLAIDEYAGRAKLEPPSVLPPGRATYLLADGETFSLHSQGGIQLR